MEIVMKSLERNPLKLLIIRDVLLLLCYIIQNMLGMLRFIILIRSETNWIRLIYIDSSMHRTYLTRNVSQTIGNKFKPIGKDLTELQNTK